MQGFITRVLVVASLLVSIALVGAFPRLSHADQAQVSDSANDYAPARKRPSPRGRANPLTYRSPGAMHKLRVPDRESELNRRLLSSGAARKARRYGSYTLVEVTEAEMSSLDASALERVEVRDDYNLIILRGGQIDTTAPEPQISEELRQPRSLPRSLNLVQLFGPPTPDTLAALKATGVEIVSYIPNNAYLVWSSAAGLDRVRSLRASTGIVQWESPFHPRYKLDPSINLSSVEQIPISVELLDTPEASRTIAMIKSLARGVLMSEFRASGTIHLKVLAESFKLKEVARLADVLAIEPWAKVKLNDERANQIVAGEVSTETVNSIQVTRPTTPGFISVLNSYGFNSNLDFAIDIGDTGLDIGSADPARLHQDFLDAAGNSRIAYLNDFSADSTQHSSGTSILPVHDTLGHGTLNASIAAGFNDKAGSAFRDSLGFQYGLGIAPFARVGASKIFDDDGNFSQNFTYEEFIAAAYRGGARISSNSWGACDTESGFCNLYNDDARAFDSFVRDADSAAPGNQEMILVFAAGNQGDALAQSIGMPGTAKNIITVGASENFRSSGNDGCGVGPTGADNALDIIDFSGGGPTQHGSAKPDLVAPGTHMQGAAPQDSTFATKSPSLLGVCNRFFPLGQTVYTWSSGTSHATPLVAGGAALAYQWLRTRFGEAPSPALVKALMLNSTTYISGKLSGGDLPGAHQGWGLLSLEGMFDSTERIIYDQSPSRTFTQSGGAPFEITGLPADPSKEFRVMLVWTDPPGNSATNAPYINQLNLEVIVGGTVYSANQFNGPYSRPGQQNDFVNNVQGVRLPAGTTGPFVVRVRPTIIAGDGVPGNGVDLDQDFALVISNGREVALPVLAGREAEGVTQGVTVSHSNNLSDTSLIPGETASISVTLNNDSASLAANIQSATLSLAGVTATSSFPVIQPGQSAVSTTAFQMRVPSDLRCGSIAELQLRLATDFGQVALPVRVRVGRAISDAQVLLVDDVDSRSVKVKLKKRFSLTSGTSYSGTTSYHAIDKGQEDNNDELSTLEYKKAISIPSNAGQVRLTFFHIFNFEPGYDGGVAEISTDGGATWQDLGSRIITGGYDGKVTSASENPLGNRFAWTARGQAGVFSPVVINLDDFAGKKIKIRFLAGFDLGTGIIEGYTGWFIDEVKITSINFGCQ